MAATETATEAARGGGAVRSDEDGGAPTVGGRNGGADEVGKDAAKPKEAVPKREEVESSFHLTRTRVEPLADFDWVAALEDGASVPELRIVHIFGVNLIQVINFMSCCPQLAFNVFLYTFNLDVLFPIGSSPKTWHYLVYPNLTM
uniref:DUF834 domain-containing protein n=2 Tax=Oryza sativa subsp. japonica TaxID=39947 RepID=Q69WA4_ORYSJ|nr:hypothetical protein [Oryza sativa Japonica Group]BAD30305.1 hypothetical protein [Oryza sativa Japonica Group]BAD31984.1 hypothetical protein [Oryza sativa Japonica Group]